MTPLPAGPFKDIPAGKGPAAWLLRHAAQLAALADSYGGRAEQLLRPAAAGLRDAADLYRVDPTLYRCPAGRERALDVVWEIGRQLSPLTRQAITGREGAWEEAEVMSARLLLWLEAARTQAYPDHASPQRSRELSARWLAASSHRIDEAASTLRSAVRQALSLPHPAEAAVELGRLAAVLEEHAAAQGRLRDEDLDRMDAELPR